MIEYKQSVAAFVPVRIFDASGNPKSGVPFGSVSAAVQKADGSTTVGLTVLITDWVEITASAFASAGVYALKLPSSVLDQTGYLTYAVATAGNKTHIGAIKIVANEEVDTYTRVGAPTGASISADIAAVSSSLSTVGTNVTNVYNRIGAPVGASISADIAQVESNVLATYNRIGAPVLATISADIAGVKSDVATVETNVVNTYNRIGAPVGASISADIAQVETNVLAVYSRIGAPVLASISADIAGVKTDVGTVNTVVQLLKKYDQGRWKIFTSGPDANRLVLYDSDNTTPLLKFDLKDSGGGAAYFNPFERYPVP